MCEYEIKVLLTKAEYDTLCLQIKNFQKPKIQINYYYDTPDLAFNKVNTTYRIRKVGDTFVATIKEHNSELYGRNGSNEKSKTVTGINDTAFFAINSLILMGELRTERKVCLVKQKGQIVLDKNDYLEHTDYELEIEYFPNMIEWAEELTIALFEFLQLVCDEDNTRFKRFFVGKTPNKSTRFFEKLSHT